jgi:hypothetical protein
MTKLGAFLVRAATKALCSSRRASAFIHSQVSQQVFGEGPLRRNADIDALTKSATCRYCCKSRKLHRSAFLVKTLKHEAIDDSDNLSRATDVAYEFSVRDEVPQIFTRKTRLRPSEFLTPSAKRLLQHYLPRAVVRTPATHFLCASGTDIRIPLYTSFIPSHALCFRSYNRAVRREIFILEAR